MAVVAGVVALVTMSGCASGTSDAGGEPTGTQGTAALEVPTETFEETAVETSLEPGEYLIAADDYASTGMRCTVTGEMLIQLDAGPEGLEPTGEVLTLDGVRTQCYHPDYVPDLEYVYVLVGEDGKAMMRP